MLTLVTTVNTLHFTHTLNKRSTNEYQLSVSFTNLFAFIRCCEFN